MGAAMWEEFLQKKGLTEWATPVPKWYVMDDKLWIPYPAVKKLGIPACKRYRPSPKEKPRFIKGQKPIPPYFLQQEGDTGVLLIVEGETDAATAAGAGFSVLGVPGATNWKEDWWRLAEDYDKIIVLLDSDKAAAGMLAKMAATKPDNINLLVTAPSLLKTGAHDLNDLHVANGGDFTKTKLDIKTLITIANPLKAVTDDVDAMVEAVASRLEQVTPPDDGQDRKALCIFHEEKTPSLDFGPKGFHCFGCDTSGALQTLAAILGIVPARETYEDGRYVVRDGRICQIKYTDNEVLYLPLCNFQARITREVIKDDSVEQTLTFAINGRLATGKTLPELVVPADKFSSMNWVVTGWGSAANVEAGNGVKDKLRSAIQYLSHNVEREVVFTHLGWRKLNGQWVYLHTNGAVGMPGVTVDPNQESLRKFILPDEPGSAQASLDLLDVATPEIIIPLLAAAYRAPVNCLLYPTVTLWLYGDTGSYKSTLAALVSCHFGGPFTSESLPGSWMSTENSLERALFLAHDVLYVIDDYAPEKNRKAAQALDTRVNRIVRQVGNRTARSRLRADLSGRPDFYPNALVVSTGEQLPLGVNSIAARILPVKCQRDNVNVQALTQAQLNQYALAQAMLGYIEWLALRMDDLARQLNDRFVELRSQAANASSNGYVRLASSVAHLALGWELLLDYALETGVITGQQREALWQEGWQVLINLAAAHDATLTEERPTRKFLRTLAAMLTQGLVYLANRHTGEPLYRNDFNTSGRMVGWADEEGLYLLPDAAWREVNEYLRATDGINVTQKTLEEMFANEGLSITDKGRKDKRIRVRERGVSRRRYTWAFPLDIFKQMEGADNDEDTDD